MAEDCGGTVTSQGLCSCELVSCDSCGTTFHYEDDAIIRRCDAYGNLCTDCPYICTSECCMPDHRLDGRDR